MSPDKNEVQSVMKDQDWLVSGHGGFPASMLWADQVGVLLVR